MNKNPAKKVIVALSGGVDSSVAAWLLVRQGYRVEALFMKNWEADDAADYCHAADDFADAQKIAEKLSIPLHRANFSDRYWDEVFTDFLVEYQNGRTPNPDILCNEKIKFAAFLEHACTLGADYIATGHYAKIVRKNRRFHLCAGADKNKDQSYFLYRLDQRQLSKSIFPLGEIDKKTVRAIARRENFATAEKPDSTGICFIGKRKFSHFLKNHLAGEPGNIVDTKGNIIRQHPGLIFYTIGQRKGLGIGGGHGKTGAPWFVVEKRIAENELVVVEGDSPLLYHRALIASNIHWIADTPHFPLSARAKIRHRQTPQKCIVWQMNNDKIIVIFEKPERAVAAGQAVVIYQNDDCLGGGVIEQTANEAEIDTAMTARNHAISQSNISEFKV